MIRRHQLLALGTVGLLSLVGCSTPEQAGKPAVVDSTQQASTDAANSAADAAKDAAGAANTAAGAAKEAAGAAQDTAQNAATSGTAAMSAGELMSVVTNTKTAVEAGDFAKAKEEFAKFGDSWSKVGADIKTASPDGYAAIKTNVGNVNTALENAQPDKTKVMDALAALSASISSVAKP